MCPRLVLAIATASTVLSVGLGACGNDDARPGFAIEDAAPTEAAPPSVDGSFGETDAGCPATDPPRPVTAAPPTRFTAGACSASQVDRYVTDCLQSDGNVCAAFRATNAACAACAESAGDASAWGPIVFYGARQYYDYNYGGCIANVTGDLTSAGCGAAETRYLACKRAACAPCLPSGLPRDYAPFYACENAGATDRRCAAELAEATTACAAYFAAKPVDVCQAAGLPPTDYLRRLIGGWCAGDGGDGGDGG
jgi:hypothetical protein